MKRTTPAELEFLMHCYTSGEPWPFANSAMGQAIILDFIDRGIVQYRNNSRGIGVSPLGEAWVALLLCTPPPRVAYLDQSGKEIEVP